jgi:hypothetical protein
MNQTIPSWQIPNWLQITKISNEHYRVVDTSVDSVGFHLGSFQTRQAAQRFALKVSEARAEVRNRNRNTFRPQTNSGGQFATGEI